MGRPAAGRRAVSALIWWAVIIGGFLFTYRKAYSVLADGELHEFPNLSFTAEDRAMTAVMALLLALIWPFVLVGYVIYRFATPQSTGERRQEVAARERRVADLERKLDIRGRNAP